MTTCIALVATATLYTIRRATARLRALHRADIVDKLLAEVPRRVHLLFAVDKRPALGIQAPNLLFGPSNISIEILNIEEL